MAEGHIAEQPPLEMAQEILKHLDLKPQDLAGKNVLDIGSTNSSVSKAADVLYPTAKVVAIDLEPRPWDPLEDRSKANLAQADAIKMPFQTNTFDYVLAHASVGPEELEDAVRVLKPGGELRIRPDGWILEEWNVMYYLTQHQAMDPAEAKNLIGDFASKRNEIEGTFVHDYIVHRDEAREKMTFEEKHTVLYSFLNRYVEVANLDLEYKILDPEAKDLEVVLIHRKPEQEEPTKA
jgi:SAM-dependent methyltransferase